MKVQMGIQLYFAAVVAAVAVAIPIVYVAEYYQYPHRIWVFSEGMKKLG